MELTKGQKEKLTWFRENGKPGQICKLGYSIGSRGNNNFHSTWCAFGGEPFRVDGDSRSAWKKFVKRLGMDNVV